MNNRPKLEIIPPAPNKALNGSLIGPLATLAGEPGQARKGAATACDVCAEMWLVRLPPKFFLGCCLEYKLTFLPKRQINLFPLKAKHSLINLP